MLRDDLILLLVASPGFEVLVDHIFSLEAPIALLFEFAVFDEGSDDLQDQLELV